MAESVETLGVDPRTQTKKLGATLFRKNRVFQKSYVRSEKAAENGLCSRESVPWGVAPTEGMKLR